jgi:hypothetical protein
MLTAEGHVKAGVKKYLASIGAYQFWPVQMGYGKRSVDCLGCYRGRFFAIETKAPGEIPNPSQNLVIKQVRDAGGIGIWGDNAHEIIIEFTRQLGHDPVKV